VAEAPAGNPATDTTVWAPGSFWAGSTYAAHLHNQPCAFPGNPGGGHYMNVAGAGATPPNELWFSTTPDPTPASPPIGRVLPSPGDRRTGWPGPRPRP